MKRIFLSLAIVGTLLFAYTLTLGLKIDIPETAKAQKTTLQTTMSDEELTARNAINFHMAVAMGSLVFGLFLHSVVVTYFMGTGRWIEETCEVYHLGEGHRAENKQLKYRVVMLITFCFSLFMLTMCLGAMNMFRGFSGWFGLPLSTTHFLFACTMVGVNFMTNIYEYQSISRNANLIAEVVGHVNRIRQERGLESEPTSKTSNK